jgi:hypothetical protein
MHKNCAFFRWFGLLQNLTPGGAAVAKKEKAADAPPQSRLVLIYGSNTSKIGLAGQGDLLGTVRASEF